MERTYLKSKIHRATLTETVLEYEGSITIDPVLLKATDIDWYEKVQVMNMNTGARFETYVIPGKRDSGQLCLNGPAARLGEVGDSILVVSYIQADEKEKDRLVPVVVHVDQDNRITRTEKRKG